MNQSFNNILNEAKLEAKNTPTISEEELRKEIVIVILAGSREKFYGEVKQNIKALCQILLMERVRRESSD